MSLSVSCIETRNPNAAVRAINSTLVHTPARSVYWFSNLPPPKEILAPTQWIRINKLQGSFQEWVSYLTIKLMPSVVDTKHNIIVQGDGFAINGNAWTDEFLEYDYIGAPWLWKTSNQQVGNGGFSLRSRKLYDALIDWSPGYTVADWPNLSQELFNHSGLPEQAGVPEDSLISSVYRPHLETNYNIKFAHVDLAHRFSIEGSESYTSPWFKHSLGFHGAETAGHYGITLI